MSHTSNNETNVNFSKILMSKFQKSAESLLSYELLKPMLLGVTKLEHLMITSMHVLTFALKTVLNLILPNQGYRGDSTPLETFLNPI